MMKLNKAQIELTPEDVTSLCNMAKATWDKASPSVKKVIFTWRKRRYQSRLTFCRMLVDTLDGNPVACRYH